MRLHALPCLHSMTVARSSHSGALAQGLQVDSQLVSGRALQWLVA